MGVAKINGFVILVNNTRPGDIMMRITKAGIGFAAAEVFGRNIKKDTMQEMGSNETR